MQNSSSSATATATSATATATADVINSIKRLIKLPNTTNNNTKQPETNSSLNQQQELRDKLNELIELKLCYQLDSLTYENKDDVIMNSSEYRDVVDIVKGLFADANDIEITDEDDNHRTNNYETQNGNGNGNETTFSMLTNLLNNTNNNNDTYIRPSEILKSHERNPNDLSATLKLLEKVDVVDISNSELWVDIISIMRLGLTSKQTQTQTHEVQMQMHMQFLKLHLKYFKDVQPFQKVDVIDNVITSINQNAVNTTNNAQERLTMYKCKLLLYMLNSTVDLFFSIQDDVFCRVLIDVFKLFKNCGTTVAARLLTTLDPTAKWMVNVNRNVKPVQILHLIGRTGLLDGLIKAVIDGPSPSTSTSNMKLNAEQKRQKRTPKMNTSTSTNEYKYTSEYLNASYYVHALSVLCVVYTTVDRRLNYFDISDSDNDGVDVDTNVGKSEHKHKLVRIKEFNGLFFYMDYIPVDDATRDKDKNSGEEEYTTLQSKPPSTLIGYIPQSQNDTAASASVNKLKSSVDKIELPHGLANEIKCRLSGILGGIEAKLKVNETLAL